MQEEDRLSLSKNFSGNPKMEEVGKDGIGDYPQGGDTRVFVEGIYGRIQHNSSKCTHRRETPTIGIV